ncbi:MAG: ABC transporter permease [Anaerolineaceae bacterium]|nr:ABC transporter permease [Anaerolineaceae bacterium]
MKLRKDLIERDPVSILAPVLAVALALVVGAGVLLALGKNPIEAYGAMLNGAFGDTGRLFNTITRAIPLLLVAVGICIAFRGGVINIGAEGQLFIGAISVTAFSVAVGENLPPLIFIPLALLIGFLAGALWGAIPGYLKAYFDVNEILSTVMMNQIAIQLVLFLLSGPMIDPREIELGTRIPQSARLPEAVALLRLAPPSRIHAGLFVALIAAVVVYLLLWRTPLGYRVRAVGQNKDASRYAGINVPLYTVLALALSGGLAGLAGGVELTGVTRRMVEGFAVGYGFSGIVVALFGRLHPLGAIPSAFFFGALLTGAEQMQRTIQVPSATMIALQGLVVIFVVSSDIWVRRRASKRAARAVSQPAPIEMSMEPIPSEVK